MKLFQIIAVLFLLVCFLQSAIIHNKVFDLLTLEIEDVLKLGYFGFLGGLAGLRSRLELLVRVVKSAVRTPRGRVGL